MELRPATSVRVDELVELTHALRADLLARGEFLPSSWVEEAAEDLRAGRRAGWVLGAPGPTGLAFYSLRPHRGYAHVHVTPGGDPVARAARLLREVFRQLPEEILRGEAGVTGLSEPEEEALGREVQTWPGFTVLVRRAMDVDLTGRPPVPLDPLPPSLSPTPARTIPTAALAALDLAAFQGTPDESLVADTVEEDEQVVRDILSGSLGRFLDEASTAIVSDQGHLVGALLTVEHSPRRSVFVDLVVHPSHKRRGLGRYLLRFGLRASAALGYSQVRLWVTETNAPALALYEANGFRPVLRAAVYRFVRPIGDASPHPQAAR